MPGFPPRKIVGAEPIPPIRTGAVVALKDLPRAKTRFTGIDPQVRERLTWAMALDTLDAASGACDHTVLVTAEPTAGRRLADHGLAVRTVPDPGGEDPLNSAFLAGIEALRHQGCTLVACIMADLPALTASVLGSVIEDALTRDQPVLVTDAEGIGTTMIIGIPGQLRPRFGGRSAERHRAAGMREVSSAVDLRGARADVDDHVGLRRAYAIGLGPHTAELLAGEEALADHPARSRAGCR